MYVHDVDMPPLAHEYYNCECVPYDMYIEIEVGAGAGHAFIYSCHRVICFTNVSCLSTFYKMSLLICITLHCFFQSVPEKLYGVILF